MTMVVGRPRLSLPCKFASTMSRKSKSKYKRPVSASQSKCASRVTTTSSASCACAGRTEKVQINAMATPSSAVSPQCRPEPCSSLLLTTCRPLAANWDETQHVREGKHEAAGAGIHPEAEISGQIDGNLRSPRVADGWARDVARASNAVDPHAGEEIDAVDRAMSAKQRNAILPGDLGRVLAVANLDDVRAQEVGRRPAIEVHPQPARRQKITEIPHVILLEERRVARDRAGEHFE